jgi:LacI family transcriptional regulator
MLIPSLTNPAFARIVRGAYRRAFERDIVVLVAEDLDEQHAGEMVARLVQDGRIDGLVIASARPKHPLYAVLSASAIPHVFLNRAVPGSGRNVILDEESVCRAAVSHLVRLGHKRIAHISGPLDLDPAVRRAQAFERATRSQRIDGLVVEGASFLEDGGADAGMTIFRDHPDITAVFTSTPSQAIGLYHAAAQHGRTIPADMSVITHSDLPVEGYLTPPLTAVAVPLEELGAAGVDALLAEPDGAHTADIVVPTRPKIVKRGSTGPPPGRLAR